MYVDNFFPSVHVPTTCHYGAQSYPGMPANSAVHMGLLLHAIGSQHWCGQPPVLENGCHCTIITRLDFSYLGPAYMVNFMALLGFLDSFGIDHRHSLLQKHKIAFIKMPCIIGRA